MIPAGFLDPSNNGFDIGDAAAILGFALLAATTVITSTRWLLSKLRAIVQEEILAATAPISPTANGGLSLPDVARTSARNEQTLALVAAHLGIQLPDPNGGNQ